MLVNAPAAPADAIAGTPQPPSNPGAEGDAPIRDGETTTPEQDPALKPKDGEGKEAPDGESAAETAEKIEAKQPKPKSRQQRRVETLIDEKKSLERQLDLAQRKLERQGQPRRLDPLAFNSDADYQRALIRETARESSAEFARSQAQSAVEQTEVVEQQIWETRVSGYKEAVPDFEAIAYSTGVTYSKHGLQMVRQHDEGPRIAYYLGKNTAEALRISQLSPLDTAFALGGLAERLTGPPKKVVSGAPNPVPTVRGRAAATGFKPDSDDSDGYRKWRDSLSD